MTPVLAHAADWLSSLIFLAPVLLVAGWLALSTWRERRRGGEGGEGSPGIDDREERADAD